MASSGAKFTVEATASSPRGYDATAGQVLDLTLETNPAVDVWSCVYSVARANPGATAPTFSNVGVAEPVNATVTCTIPAEVGAWIIRCMTNGGEVVVRADGTKDYSVNVYDRAVVVRTTGGNLRYFVLGETVEYSEEGWVEDLNALVDAIAGGAVIALSNATPQAASAAAGSAGASTSASRADHVHQVSTGTPTDVGTANAAGAATSLARSDHVHALHFAPVQAALAAASGAIAVNGQKISGLASPTAGTSEAATATYAEGVVTFARVNAALLTANASIDINAQGFVGVAFVSFGAAVNVASAGLLRSSGAAQTLLAATSIASPSNDLEVLRVDGADNVLMGGSYALALKFVSQTSFNVKSNDLADQLVVDHGNELVSVTNYTVQIPALVISQPTAPTIVIETSGGGAAVSTHVAYTWGYQTPNTSSFELVAIPLPGASRCYATLTITATNGSVTTSIKRSFVLTIGPGAAVAVAEDVAINADIPQATFNYNGWFVTGSPSNLVYAVDGPTNSRWKAHCEFFY